MTLAKGPTLKDALEQRLEGGSAFGDVEMLRVLMSLSMCSRTFTATNSFTATSRMQMCWSRPMERRDPAPHFGFAKADGETDIRSGDSFWAPEAARFSPLSKLDNPGRAAASHDVFWREASSAIPGSSTGEFPWQVTGTEDRRVLQEKMRLPSPSCQ